MTNEELKTKTVNVSESQLNLLLDNNAYLRTILDLLMKDLNLDESEIAKKFDKFKSDALDQLSLD